jgi:hypothetical protein
VAGTIVGTLAGVVITQRHADQREDIAWRREQARWQREDAARTFDYRREAYADFYESLREMSRCAYNHGMGLAEEEELGEWQMPTFRKLEHLRVVVGSRDDLRPRRWRLLRAAGAIRHCGGTASGADARRPCDPFRVTPFPAANSSRAQAHRSPVHVMDAARGGYRPGTRRGEVSSRTALLP